MVAVEMAAKGTVAIAGDGEPIKSVTRNLSEDVQNGKNCLVRIKGQWYDMAEFMDSHPGGNILKEFVGKDITVMYRLWHPTHVFNHPEAFVTPVPTSKIIFTKNSAAGKNNVTSSSQRFSSTESSTDPGGTESESGTGSDGSHSTRQRARGGAQGHYFLEENPPALAAADKKYLEIYSSLEKRGFFKGSTRFLIERFALIFGFFSIAAYCFHYCESFAMHAVGGYCFFQIWYQCAAIMHDTGHNQYFDGNIKKNDRLMFLTANIGLGFSKSFWKWEHIEHHSFANSFDPVLGNADPQNCEEVWYHDWQLVDYAAPNNMTWFVLRIQGLFFPIACFFAGRLGVQIDGWVTETRPIEYAHCFFENSSISWMMIH